MKILNALKYLKNSLPRYAKRISTGWAIKLLRLPVNLSECVAVIAEQQNVWLKVSPGYQFLWDYKNENSLITLPAKGTFEPIETAHVQSLVGEGNTTFDVGANFGWFTTHMADLVGSNGSVYSFEPIPETFEALSLNVERNGFAGHVHLNNVAVGDSDGEEVLQIPIRMGAGAPFASLKKQTWGKYREIPVKLVSLDNYVSRHSISKIDFLKCDVEGAEMLVLKGLKDTLSTRLIAKLMLELNDSSLGKFGYSRSDVLQLMKSYGYDAYTLNKTGEQIPCVDVADLVSENVFFRI
jgi:FkbM family methyltransferase